jgi:RimJ/RimL family protein N-acetyltransferase
MIIATERLILRDFVQDDWPAVLAYQSDPRYLAHYRIHWEERTEQDVREFVQMFIGHQQAEPRVKFQLAITLREDGRLIGNCGVRKKHAGAHEADMGYELAPDYWGRGYATEAARAMLAFAFDDLKLHRVSADCIAENVASAHVLEKLGMQQEGRLRENEWFKGRWWDTLLYAILEQEWRR